MAINWDQLGNKLNQLLHNYAEFSKKYYDFFAAPPKDIPLEFYDENGNLVSKSIPNIAKLRDRFISSVNSVMEKTVYIDADNGDDETGDGSSGAPFRTLKKAIESIPSGGRGIIVVKSDYVRVENTVAIENRYIIINRAHIKFKIFEDNGKKMHARILLRNSILNISDCTIETVGSISSNENFVENWGGPFLFLQGFSQVTGWNVHYKLNSDYIGRVYPNEGIFGSLGIFTGTIEGFVNYIISMAAGASSNLHVLNTQIKSKKRTDQNDTTEYAEGVIKDSNGVPRNIITNIIL